MARAPVFASSFLVAASVLWLILLSGGSEDLAAGPALLLGGDVVLLSLIAAAGLLIARSAWARITGAVVALALLPLLLLDSDRGPLIWVAAGLSVLAFATMLSPGVAKWIDTSRGAGPPGIAVVLLIGLLLSPAVAAIASPSETTVFLWVLAAAGPLAAIGYSRASVGTLWAIRIGTLPVCLLAAATPPLGGGLIAIGYGLAITTLSWQKAVLLAAQPLTPLPSPGYRIPPELAPTEILEAADLDESGRPRR